MSDVVAREVKRVADAGERARALVSALELELAAITPLFDKEAMNRQLDDQAAELRTEISALRQENATLRTENTDLKAAQAELVAVTSNLREALQGYEMTFREQVREVVAERHRQDPEVPVETVR
jgi:regulator of replication initiation timing